MEHFRKLSQEEKNDYKSPLFEHPEDHGEITTEINTDFTEAGILVSISRLKNNKPCESDYIHNELIKSTTNTYWIHLQFLQFDPQYWLCPRSRFNHATVQS